MGTAVDVSVILEVTSFYGVTDCDRYDWYFGFAEAMTSQPMRNSSAYPGTSVGIRGGTISKSIGLSELPTNRGDRSNPDRDAKHIE